MKCFNRDSKCTHDTYTKSDFADITATIKTDTSSSIGSAIIAFPDGFNKDNCVVISTMYKCELNSNNYISGVVSTITKEVIVTLGKTDGSDDNNIYIQITDDSLAGLTFTVKVRLMKL